MPSVEERVSNLEEIVQAHALVNREQTRIISELQEDVFELKMEKLDYSKGGR